MGRRILICLFVFFCYINLVFQQFLIFFSLFSTGDADSQCGSVIYLFLLFGGGGGTVLK